MREDFIKRIAKAIQNGLRKSNYFISNQEAVIRATQVADKLMPLFGVVP